VRQITTYLAAIICASLGEILLGNAAYTQEQEKETSEDRIFGGSPEIYRKPATAPETEARRVKALEALNQFDEAPETEARRVKALEALNQFDEAQRERLKAEAEAKMREAREAEAKAKTLAAVAEEALEALKQLDEARGELERERLKAEAEAKMREAREAEAKAKTLAAVAEAVAKAEAARKAEVDAVVEALAAHNSNAPTALRAKADAKALAAIEAARKAEADARQAMAPHIRRHYYGVTPRPAAPSAAK